MKKPLNKTEQTFLHELLSPLIETEESRILGWKKKAINPGYINVDQAFAEKEQQKCQKKIRMMESILSKVITDESLINKQTPSGR